MPTANGKCGSNRQVQAHHIKTWANASYLRYDVDNGITLCRDCHERVTGHENHYEQIFSEIVRKKKS